MTLYSHSLIRYERTKSFFGASSSSFLDLQFILPLNKLNYVGSNSKTQKL